MRNRFAIFAAISLFALSPASSARASPNDPIPEVKSVEVVPMQTAQVLPSTSMYNFNQKIEVVMNIEVMNSIAQAENFRFTDRSTASMFAVTTSRASPSYIGKRSDLPMRMRSTNYLSLTVEQSMVRRRCRYTSERHAEYVCDISTANRRAIG